MCPVKKQNVTINELINKYLILGIHCQMNNKRKPYLTSPIQNKNQIFSTEKKINRLWSMYKEVCEIVL